MNESKFKILELVKDKAPYEVDELIEQAKKVLCFLTDEVVVEKPKEEISEEPKAEDVPPVRPVLEIINETIESDKTLKDPLEKEYLRYYFTSNFIKDELQKGLVKLCSDIDKKLGAPAPEEIYRDKLEKVYTTGLCDYEPVDENNIKSFSGMLPPTRTSVLPTVKVFNPVECEECADSLGFTESIKKYITKKDLPVDDKKVEQLKNIFVENHKKYFKDQTFNEKYEIKLPSWMETIERIKTLPENN